MISHSVRIPAGCSIFPKEIFRGSRRWVEQRYTKLVYFNELDKGGHFAAFEQPEVFVRELRACFPLRLRRPPSGERRSLPYGRELHGRRRIPVRDDALGELPENRSGSICAGQSLR